jgi:hypothetical protein
VNLPFVRPSVSTSIEAVSALCTPPMSITSWLLMRAGRRRHR